MRIRDILSQDRIKSWGGWEITAEEREAILDELLHWKDREAQCQASLVKAMNQR